MSNLLFFRRCLAYRHAARLELHKARMRLRELLQEFERNRAREERQAAKGGSGGGR